MLCTSKSVDLFMIYFAINIKPCSQYAIVRKESTHSSSTGSFYAKYIIYMVMCSFDAVCR